MYKWICNNFGISTYLWNIGHVTWNVLTCVSWSHDAGDNYDSTTMQLLIMYPMSYGFKLENKSIQIMICILFVNTSFMVQIRYGADWWFGDISSQK